MTKLALIGRDVSRSHSKIIHESILSAYGISCRYDLLSVCEEDLNAAIGKLREEYVGFNVTMPYKESVLGYLSSVSDTVAATDSCNTVLCRSGRLFGESTDGAGFVRSLGGFCSLSGKEVLLLGAGGAASSVAYAAGSAGAALTVCNRTREKADCLAEKFNNFAKSCDIEMCFCKKYDIIINATSVGSGKTEGMSPVDLSRFSLPGAAVDIIYRPARTKFLSDAEQLGIPVLNGFRMLFYQALAADRLWFDLPNDDGPAERVLAGLEKEIAV